MAQKCNLFDRVWVPSAFNVRTFASSGVVRAKLQVVHEGFDPALYALL